MAESTKVEVATIGRPHGVKGLLHIQPNVEEPDLLALFPYLEDEKGYRWHVKWHGRGASIASLVKDEDGSPLSSREEAAQLTLRKLFVPRAFLPPPQEEEFYASDLEGMAYSENGKLRGVVKHVHDYGGGVFLELSDGRLIPFHHSWVPHIHCDEGWLAIVEPPLTV